MRSVLSLFLPAVLLFVSSAAADPILTVGFNQGTVGDSVTPGTAFTVCSNSTNASTLSQGCGGSLLVGDFRPGVGQFTGSGQAVATTTGGLSLGSATSLDVWRVNSSPDGYSGSLPRYFAFGQTTAGITDTVTVLGADGLTNGFLQLVFGLDGSITESVDFFTGDGFNPDVVGNTFFASGTVSLGANGISRGAVNGVVTLDVPVLFGADQLLALSLNTTASADILVSEGYRVVTDFLNTATLTNASIRDSSGQLIPGARLSSATGYTYGELNTTPPQSVPEPGTLAMVGLGLGVLYRSRRKLMKS